jgi:hypothetical protein
MQIVKKILIIALSIWIALLVLMPKKRLYYTLEHQLAKNDIRLNEKEIDETIFSLKTKEIDIYYTDTKIANTQLMDFTTYLFYNSVNIHNIEFDNSLQSTIGLSKINDVNLSYSIFSPTKVNIEASGSFGEIKGYIDFNRTIHLDFIEVGNIQSFKSELKKNNHGWYYENRF